MIERNPDELPSPSKQNRQALENNIRPSGRQRPRRLRPGREKARPQASIWHRLPADGQHRARSLARVHVHGEGDN